jgi:hypothetical protein
LTKCSSALKNKSISITWYKPSNPPLKSSSSSTDTALSKDISQNQEENENTSQAKAPSSSSSSIDVETKSEETPQLNTEENPQNNKKETEVLNSSTSSNDSISNLINSQLGKSQNVSAIDDDIYDSLFNNQESNDNKTD